MQGILSDTCASYVRYDENTHRRILEEKVSFALSAPQNYFVHSHEEAYPSPSPWGSTFQESSLIERHCHYALMDSMAFSKHMKHREGSFQL